MDLCEAVAMLARYISSQYVDTSGLTAFTACRLVALDKCPGVRPIGIGEVLRRIVGKAILAVPHRPRCPASDRSFASVHWTAGRLQGCSTCNESCLPRSYHRSCPLGGCHQCLLTV